MEVMTFELGLKKMDGSCYILKESVEKLLGKQGGTFNTK